MTLLGKPIVDITLDYDQSIALGDLDGRDWTRITPWWTYDADDLGLPGDNLVAAANYTYGRNRFIVGDFDTGLATVVLNNDSGEWSPASGVHQIGGDKIAPGMFIRIWYSISDLDAVEAYLEANTPHSWTNYVRRPADDETAVGLHDGRTWTIHVATPNDITLSLNFGDVIIHKFTGRILHIQDRYDEGGLGAVTVVHAADIMADLAQYEPGALGTPRTAESADNRFLYIAQEALNASDLSSPQGNAIYNVEASDLPSNYLAEARICMAAEGGAVFADHGRRGGAITNYGANWLTDQDFSATVQQILGTTRIRINQAVPNYSLTRIFNTLIYSNSSTTVTKTDASSIADYSTRTLIRQVLNNDNTDLDTIATRDLAIVKDARLVIETVTIKPDTIFEQVWCGATLYALAIGNLVEVTIENNGWSYTQNLHIAGVSESWDAASDDWTVTLRLDSRDGATVIS